MAEAETKLGEAEARVETLTRQVFLTMPAEQREIQARIAQARSGRDRTGLEEAGSALNTAKRQRNACIDELAAAKSAVAER